MTFRRLTISLAGLALIALAASGGGRAMAEDKTLLKAREGAAALLRGQYEKALAAYDEALTSPEIADFIKASIYSDRGIAKWRMKQTGEAVEDFNLSIKLAPDNASVYNNRGNALLDLGHAEEAVKDFDRAISLSPNYGAAYNNRGNARTLLAQYQPAFQDFRKAVELMPTSAVAFNGRGKAHAALNRYHAAVRDFSKAISINAKYVAAYENRGRAYLTLERYAEAAEDFTQVLAQTPEQPELLLLRGRSNLGERKFNAALEDLNKAIELKADLAEAYIERGALYVQAKRFENAIADLSRAIELNPENAKAYALRAEAKFQAAPPRRPAQESVVTKQSPGGAEGGAAAETGAGESVVAKQSADPNAGTADAMAGADPSLPQDQATATDGAGGPVDPAAPVAEQGIADAQATAGAEQQPGEAGVAPATDASGQPVAESVPQPEQPDAAMMADVEKAIILAPQDAGALRVRADIHRAMERTDLAVADYQHALSLDPFQPESRAALTKLGQEVPKDPGEPLDQPVKEWIVKETSTGRFVATNPRYKALRVELEMFGSGKPKILEWSLMRDALAGIGLLRYYAGDFGDGGNVDLVYTAIVDLYANKVVAIEPYSWGSTQAQWNWQAVSVVVTDPDGIASEIKLRRGRVARGREETAEYGFPFFGGPGPAQPRSGRRPPQGGGGGNFLNWLFR
jgi:tetratricopeptide (TPR) repeat protein